MRCAWASGDAHVEAARERVTRRREYQGPSADVAGQQPASLQLYFAQDGALGTNTIPRITAGDSRDAPAARAGGFSAVTGLSSGFSFDQPPVLVAGTS